MGSRMAVQAELARLIFGYKTRGGGHFVGVRGPQIAQVEIHRPRAVHQIAATVVRDDYVRQGRAAARKLVESGHLELGDAAVVARAASAIGDPLVLGAIEIHPSGIRKIRALVGDGGRGNGSASVGDSVAFEFYDGVAEGIFDPECRFESRSRRW